MVQQDCRQRQKDPLWHFRVGYAHYYLDQYDEAIKAFEKAHKLDPEDQDIIEFLEWSRNEAGVQEGPDDAEDSGDAEDSAEEADVNSDSKDTEDTKR